MVLSIVTNCIQERTRSLNAIFRRGALERMLSRGLGIVDHSEVSRRVGLADPVGVASSAMLAGGEDRN